jgi:hypothetical protein
VDAVSINQVVLTLMDQLNSELFWIGFKLMMAAVMVLVIKDILQGAAAYFLFRLDPYVGLGTPVELVT